MIGNRKKLAEDLQATIINLELYEEKNDKLLVSLVNKINKKRGINRINIIKVLRGADLSVLTDQELYWYCEEIFENKRIEQIYPEYDYKKFFSKLEREEYEKGKMEGFDYPYVFDNILKIDEDRWLTYLTTMEIRNLFNMHIIDYNSDTQRELVVKEKNGNTIYKIDINPKSVKEIRELLKKRLYIPDTICLNANLDNPKTELIYNTDDKELILNKGVLDIGDGMHRIMAICSTEIDDIVFPVEICKFNTERMNIYITQKNKQNKMKRKQALALDPLNVMNDISDEINRSSRMLRGKIQKTSTIRTKEPGIIDRTFMVSMLNRLFKINGSRASIISLEDTLIDGLDKFFKSNLNLLENERGKDKDISEFDLILILSIINGYWSKKKEIDAKEMTEIFYNESIRNELKDNKNHVVAKWLNEIEESIK